MRASTTQSVEIPARLSFVDEAVPATGKRAQVYGPFRECSSIANVATAFADTLMGVLPEIALHGYTGRPFFDARLDNAAGLDREAPIGIFFGVPDFVGDSVFRHPTRIGGFVCETSRIPQTWADVCNRFDLILVPSQYCRGTFLDSGVRVPILVVPHGLEPSYHPLGPKRRRDPLIFYNSANAHIPGRKSLEELLRCFQRAFQGRRDVRLRLRAERTSSMRRYLIRYSIGPDDPLIRLEEPRQLATEEFAAVYSEVHCTVHPSKGEGFGLIPFQSIACETPVIAPRSTGMAEYLDASNAMLLRTKGICETPDVYYEEGTYPAVDEDHLVELLRHAERNWEAEYAKVQRVGPAFRERYRWDKVLAEIVALIVDLSRVDDPGARRRLIRERVA